MQTLRSPPRGIDRLRPGWFYLPAPWHHIASPTPPTGAGGPSFFARFSSRNLRFVREICISQMPGRLSPKIRVHPMTEPPKQRHLQSLGSQTRNPDSHPCAVERYDVMDWSPAKNLNPLLPDANLSRLIRLQKSMIVKSVHHQIWIDISSKVDFI